MKPVNLDNSPCTPQSSNCVIWQGPDIPCIKLCAGDVVTDVIYNLAMELCTILDQLDVKNYDLTCFGINNCGPNDFNALIQFLIDQICELQGVTPTPEKSGSGCPDCIVSTAQCFILKGYPAAMQLLEYVNAIATEICSIIDRLAEIDTAISQLQTDVEYIKNNYCQECDFIIPPASVTCISLTNAGVVTNTPDIVLTNFFTNVWCDLFTVLFASNNGTDLTVLTDQFNPTTCSLSDINTALSLSLSSASTLPEALANIWEILCALKDPITLTAEDTPTIITTLSAGPDYVISSKINDTGWKNLEGFGYMFSNSDRPQCRRIGNEVHFRGYITIPMGTTGDGESGTVISAANPYSYVGEEKGKTFNTIDSGNATDSCLLKTYNDGTWSTGQKAIKLFFNKGNSVIPSGILGAGQQFDKSYTKGTRDNIFRVVTVEHSTLATKIDAALSTIVGITIRNNGELIVSTVLSDESYASSTSGLEYSSTNRSIISNIKTNDYVPTFTPTAPSQYNAVASGVYSNSELTASDYVWLFDQDAGDAAQLGGFQLRLDGLKAFIDPCDTDVVTYATCS